MAGLRKVVRLLGALVVMVVSVLFMACERDETVDVGEGISFNETGYPIVDETIQFTIATKKRHDVAPFGEMQFWRDMEERTNVRIDWDITPDDVWPEKKSLIFASGDLPDAVYGSWTLTVPDILSYADQGLLIPLNDLIEEYAPNIQALFEQRPAVRRSITAPDGNIYTLPSVRERGNFANLAMFINQEWLDTLGLEHPETMEELKDVLIAFKTEDPNGNGLADEIPLTFSGLKWAGIYPLFSAFGVSLTGGSNGAGWFAISAEDPDTLVWATTTDAFKAGMQYFADLYSEGPDRH